MKPAQIAEFTNADDGIKTIVFTTDRFHLVRLQDTDSGFWIDDIKMFPLDRKDTALTYAKNVAEGVPTS